MGGGAMMPIMSQKKAERMSRRQRGFSLIELMITILLGSMIVMAVTQLFIANQRTFVLQQGLTDVQEQGRFALEYIARDARRVGLRQPGVTGGPEPGVMLTDLALGGSFFPASSEGGDGPTANDRLTFSFHGLAGAEDCEGDALAAAAAPALIVNTYWVDGQRRLRCLGSVNTGSGGITILDGIDSFQVLYGVDTQEDGVPFASRYVRADELSGDDQVVTIRVGLLARAIQENLPELADPPDYIVLDHFLETGAAPLDTRAVRRLFVTTIRARNYTWERI